MKTVLILMSFVLITHSVFVFAQNSDFDQIRRRMELHEEMHRRMREKILFGRGGDDIFKDLDKMFNDMMNDAQSFEPRDEFNLSSSTFTSEWKSEEKGKTLILKPKDQSVQLDINVKDQLINISSKQEIKDKNSQIESSSSSVFPVPYECDGNKVQMKSVGNSIHLFFPFKSGVAPTKEITLPKKKNGDLEDRRPITPFEEDVEI